MKNNKAISKKTLCMHSEDIICAYVQIPFCRSLCNFCCWCKKYNPSEILSIDRLKEPYLEALEREISARSQFRKEREKVNLEVIHFGGGTPSLLSPDELHDILSTILTCYDQQLENIMTVGIEVRPDDLSREKLEALKSVGFNRISIGAQSFDQGVLDRLHRCVSVKQFYRSYDWIRSAGFEDVNIDLLYGIPFQTFDHIKNDIRTVTRLEPEHVDAHPWKPVPGALLKAAEEDYEKEKDKKIQWASYIRDRLEAKGYRNYNHRCFAKPGKENLMHLVEATYSLPFLAFGAGSEQFCATKTTTSIQEYINDPSSSDIYKKIPGGSGDFNLLLFIDSMIRQLLLPEGIHIPFFNKRHNCDMEEVLSFYSHPENIIKELVRYRNTLIFLFEASRIQIFKKILNWIERGIIEKCGDYLRLKDEHKISHETWVLYMQAC